MKRILFLFFLLALMQMLSAQTDTLEIVHSDDFELSGSGDHEAWSNTDWVDINLRFKGAQSYRTQTKVLYSNTGIYFLFSCEDNAITATYRANNKDLYEEDVVEVFLWTDEDYPFYFEYELSPLNYELPIFVPNVKGDFFGWLPWHYEGSRRTRHKVHIQKSRDGVESWTAEFFIPYDLLKPMSNVPPSKGSYWRANMYRIDYDEGVTYWNWQPIKKNYHDYELFGWFKFQ